ncbi:hypothetical protein [Halalkalibacter krulwichiae]|uniref:Uncharacterized protein n=1 Tax=Halalkalibacter krulwichiae TaxID=199441 RepID=A0A1X9MGC3_9BACI|nr:hypothetical protein [Halalkalibacter krulwichiae]ARK32497.1 hypothetical protein BkAM31D_22980 [Halalkalibacter krulwichiae]
MSYFKQRMKQYKTVSISLLIGFIIVTLLFDKPDYPKALLAIVIGLLIGEAFVYLKWRRKNK